MKKYLPLFAALLVIACGGDATKIRPASFAEMQGWKNDNLSTPFKVFLDSCRVNQTRNGAWQSKMEGPVGVRENWDYACSKAEQLGEPGDSDARRFFETNFQPYKVETESQPTGLVTGYYEPIINGSTTRQGPYQTPVYGVPKDLTKPYLTRAEIVAGGIKGKAPVLYWVDDPVMLFFLHIQGSGKVRLPDGRFEGIQYAAQNGYGFTPIGRILKESGELTNVSMQSIRDWLKANPDRADEVMNQNESYVFFKKGPGDKAAKGALGIPLTPLRSIAVDDDRAAYGVPTYLDTMQTEYKSGRQIPLRRLFVSQDTGGALKGPHRADLFYGQGAVEEWQAGHQNARADTYWLLPTGPKAEPVKPIEEPLPEVLPVVPQAEPQSSAEPEGSAEPEIVIPAEETPPSAIVVQPEPPVVIDQSSTKPVF